MQTHDIDKPLEMKRLIDEEGIADEDVKILSLSYQSKEISNTCPYLGIILAVISAIFFTMQSVIVKLMMNVHPAQLVVYQSMGILLPAIPILIWQNECPFPKGKRLLLVLRSFSGTAAMGCMFYSFQHMPLADATVLSFSFPVFVAIFARLFLKEPCGLFHVITILMTLFGVVLIARPPFIFGSNVPGLPSNHQLGKTDLLAAVAAFSAALITANTFICIRALKGVHFSVSLLSFGTVELIVSLTTAWSLGALCWPQCGTDRLLTVILALSSFGGQFLVTRALQLEQAGPVSIARSTDIVFVFVLQILFFQEIPNYYSIAGTILVTISVLLSTIRTWVLTLPKTSTLHKIFCIFES